VLLAGLYHQTNTFVGGRTGLENFEIGRSEEILRERRGWEVLPVLDMRALLETPGARSLPSLLIRSQRFTT